LFQFADDPPTAMELLTEALLQHVEVPARETPAIAHSVKPE
jgi:hypothetical protein